MNEPTVTARQVTARLDITLAYEVTGVALRPRPYSRSGQEYRPERVTLSIQPGTDGWDVDLALRGPRVLKSGKDGEDTITERIYGQAAEPENLPEWLADIRDEALSYVATKGWTA